MDLRVSALSRASERILTAARAWDAIAPHASPYDNMVVWDAASTPERPDALQFSAAETAEPNLGHIVENLRVQWALHESPLLRGVTEVRSGLTGPGIRRRLRARHARGRSPAHLPARDRRRRQPVRRAATGGHRPLGLDVRPGGGRRAPADGAAASRDGWQRFLPSGPLAFLPLKDGRVSLVWSTTPAEAQALQTASEQEFSERVSVASDFVLGKATLASGRAGFPLALWHARAYVQPRLALVGDAAHTIHPLAGQGVNLGFLDCASLVQVFAEASAKGEELHGLRVLRRYERWRRSENAVVMGICDTLNRLFTEKSVAVAGLRRFGMSVVTRQPFMRRALIERALGVGGDAPQLARHSTSTT